MQKGLGLELGKITSFFLVAFNGVYNVVAQLGQNSLSLFDSCFATGYMLEIVLFVYGLIFIYTVLLYKTTGGGDLLLLWYFIKEIIITYLLVNSNIVEIILEFYSKTSNFVAHAIIIITLICIFLPSSIRLTTKVRNEGFKNKPLTLHKVRYFSTNKPKPNSIVKKKIVNDLI